jgi:integrase
MHPHMLRHSTGFKLADDGRDTRSIQLYLGHKNIQHDEMSKAEKETSKGNYDKAIDHYKKAWGYSQKTIDILT